MTTPPVRRVLSQDQRESISELGRTLAQDYENRSTAELVQDLPYIRLRLPNSLSILFEEIRENRTSPGYVLSGFPLGEKIERTPETIKSGLNQLPPSAVDASYFALISGLGQPFTFDTIQNANFINDVVPIRQNADKPISSGFSTDFGLHTEDAFHPAAGDFLSLLCVRNHDVATTISFLRDYRLSDSTIRILSEPHFRVGNNIGHAVNGAIRKTPVLYGVGEHRRIRINFNNTICDRDDAAGLSALDELKSEAERNVQRVALQSGDILILDNMTAAHGREAFVPRFDGTDRWLKRLYVTTGWRFCSIYEVPGTKFVVQGHVM